jgi:4'-phosphopantetheinyl transferase
METYRYGMASQREIGEQLSRDELFGPPWRSPPDSLTLASDEVHVWRASLNCTAAQVEILKHILSAEELRRAGRYRFQKDREHFIVARGLLRTILGRYLDVEPGQLRFCYGPHGKPALKMEPGEDTLSFNLSHSHELCLFAVSRGRELGVDVEYIQAHLADDQIAERFFAPREVELLRGLPNDVQREAFFIFWTRKEAFIKATGKGLSLPLNQFEVSLVPGKPIVLLSANGDHQETFRWSLQPLAVGSGYAAALCVEGHDWRLKGWQWAEGYSEAEVHSSDLLKAFLRTQY